MSLWDKFDEEFDVERIKADVVDAKENGSGRQREKVPYGKYRVKIERMDIVTTKKKPPRPMLTAWLRIVEGEHKNNILYLNQLIDEAWKINQSCRFLQSLTNDVEIQFKNHGYFHSLVLTLHEFIDGNHEYDVVYGQTNTGFPTYDIVKIHDL